jgi:hypothetical protein
MTRDLDALLRDADPLRDAADDAALLSAARDRVDRERAGAVPGRRRLHWGHRTVLIAAAAAVVTAVPLAISVLGGDDGPRPLLPPAIAADGSISCESGYTAAVRPEDAEVRLLPDRLPDGWSYTQLFARQDDPAACGPPSLTALRQDATGLVTGRVAVTGPIDLRVNQGKLVESVPDTVFGHAAHRFDVTSPEGIEYHRWVWSDEQGQWSAEASGMPLDAARQTLAAVMIDGPQVAWNAVAAPGWTLVHLREGPPYGTVPGPFWWSVELTDGSQRRTLNVTVEEPPVPLLAGTGIGERVTTLDGHPAVLSQVRTAVDSGAAETDVRPGTVSQPVLIEVAPGTVAYSIAIGDDLAEVEDMLASLRQVAADDPRLEKYGTD